MTTEETASVKSVSAASVSVESVCVDTSEPGFISVHYVQLDNGLELGGRLRLERKSVPLVMALLYACLNVLPSH